MRITQRYLMKLKQNLIYITSYIVVILAQTHGAEMSLVFKSTAKKLYEAKKSSECNPYEALTFVELCNANIHNLYHNRNAHTRMRFLQSELGSLQNTILISIVGLGCYMLTMFHCIPNMLGIAFMATIGLIGLISAEQIILRPTDTDLLKKIRTKHMLASYSILFF